MEAIVKLLEKKTSECEVLRNLVKAYSHLLADGHLYNYLRDYYGPQLEVIEKAEDEVRFFEKSRDEN